MNSEYDNARELNSMDDVQRIIDSLKSVRRLYFSPSLLPIQGESERSRTEKYLNELPISISIAPPGSRGYKS